jgi:glutamate 5-kinase
VEIIWVTSGAIASAVERTGHRRKNRPLADKQALSAIGQPMVMELYNLALQAAGSQGAQVLLTADDLRDRKRRGNLQATLERLLEWKVTPILNENDAVSTEEIRFGDNDSLSAKVARALGADRLVILTDVDGLYDSDPRKSRMARLVPSIPAVTAPLLKQLTPGAAGTARGTGGMYSKLLAAREASKSGIPTWLVRGDTPGVLAQLAAGAPIGTRIGHLEGAPSARRQRKG